MAVPVADRGSNKDELIVHAAEVLGRSPQRLELFKAIYRGQKKRKSVSELMSATQLSHKRVLVLGKQLADNDIVDQIKVNGTTAYAKIQFFTQHRDKILELRHPKARASVATKRRPQGRMFTTAPLAIKINTHHIKIRHITIDEIDSFSKVKGVNWDYPSINMAEKKFKSGVAKILGEGGTFPDWGGELRDLSSTRVRIGGKRHMTAIAFKGPGTKGQLVPGKMGKNGDQIQRLFKCPATVFIVQYWSVVDDSIYEQMEQFAQGKSYFGGRQIWYGVIDGNDPGD